MKRTRKKLEVLQQSDNVQATKNDSSGEEFDVEEVKPRLLVKKRMAAVEDKDDEEEKQLDRELSVSGCGTDFTDMSKEEKRQLVEAIWASKKEYAQEEEQHHLRHSQEEEQHHLRHSQEETVTITARQKHVASKTSSNENPGVRPNSPVHSAPDGSGDCTKRPPDVASSTETPKKLRLRRRAPNQTGGEGGSHDRVGTSTRKRTNEVAGASTPAKVLKRSDESKLDQNQNSQSDADTRDCVALLGRVKISPQYGVVRTVNTRAQNADSHLKPDGVTIDGDASSSDDSSVIFEKIVTPQSDKVHSEVQQSQDLFSDDDSPSGGATSQTAGDGSQSGRHGNKHDNETSQENLSAPKGDVIGSQKRKLNPEEDGPSPKRPVFWAWDYLQNDELPENIPPELPSRKLVNKRTLKKKLFESRRYFTPPGVSTSQCTQRIIEFFREDQLTLRRLQDHSVVMVPWGPPVRVGCHMTTTIDLRRAEEETSVDRVGVSKCLRSQNQKIEGPNSDEEFSAVRRDDNSPQIVLDSDNDSSDKDVDWLPELKGHEKKRVPARARKPANKAAKLEKKARQDENVNFDESIPDTPPGVWLKSPAAQKAQSDGQMDRQADNPRMHLDQEETANSVLMQGRAGVKDAAPPKAKGRLGVTRQRGTAKRKAGQGSGRQSRVTKVMKNLRGLFADDENSSGDDSDGKLKLKCEKADANYKKGSKQEGVGFKEHFATSSNASSFDGYFKPVAKLKPKLPSRQTDDGTEGEGAQVKFQVVATDTNTVVMDTNLVGKETSPIVRNSSSVVKETSPVAMETSPVVKKTSLVVKETRANQRGRVISAVASIAQSVVSGATSLLRGAGRTGRGEGGTGRGGGREGTQGTLFEISSSEDEELGEQQQQQQQQVQQRQQQLQQPSAGLEVEHKKQQAECPMCFKYFPLEGIEEHAFSCQGDVPSCSSKLEDAPPEEATIADIVSVVSLARKPLRQYGRQRVTRGQSDDHFDSVLEDVPVTTAVGRWKQVTQLSTTSVTRQAQDLDDVEILSDSETPHPPIGRRGKRNVETPGQEETVEGHPCPICSQSFSQTLIQTHVLRCLESAETEKRVTRSRRHPDLNGILTANQLSDDDFDENMPINPKKRQTYLHKKQTQPLITSKLMAKDVDSASDNFRKYSSVVNTLKLSSNDDSVSDSDTGSSSSVSRHFSDDLNDDRQTPVHSGMSKPSASPFQTFKRISDQRSATLDYHNQFRKGDIEKARKKSEARVNKSKRRTWKRKGRKKKGAPRKKRKLT